MSLRDNPETEHVIRDLIAAVAHEDWAKANGMVRELTTTPDDQFILMLMTARIAAVLPHEARHIANAPISPYLRDKTGPETVAMQIVSLMANHALDTAFDLATATVQIGRSHPKHTQDVVKALVGLAAHADDGVVLVGAAPDANHDAKPTADPRLN